MEKNNIGEAIVISTVILVFAYFEFEFLGVILGFFLLMPLCTWNFISSKLRDKSNQLSWKQIELQNEKLKLEIEVLKTKVYDTKERVK